MTRRDLLQYLVWPTGILLSMLLLGGCVSATVDEMTYNEPDGGIGASSVVILGRREYQKTTEFDFIQCIADHIHDGDASIKIIDEITFINEFYPWFEPRLAPLEPAAIQRFTDMPPVKEQLNQIKLEYMIWIDGETSGGISGDINNAGSMGCGVQGCFGFGTWGTESQYEATIWDVTNKIEVGKVSAVASGQSYMPAVIVPIPIIAPVQGAACDSLGDQLLEYLSRDF